eukprot:10692874-Ditylum_brightwellii.AAC.1
MSYGKQVLIVNAYVSYKRQCEIEDVKPKYTHLQFHKTCMLAWMDPEKYWPNCYAHKRKVSQTSSLLSADSSVAVFYPPKKRHQRRNCDNSTR